MKKSKEKREFDLVGMCVLWTNIINTYTSLVRVLFYLYTEKHMITIKVAYDRSNV